MRTGRLPEGLTKNMAGPVVPQPWAPVPQAQKTSGRGRGPQVGHNSLGGWKAESEARRA